MVKVCDAIMGSGKSSAAIRFMNEHKDSKFIYISPYLDEAERIKTSCPELYFVEPSNKLKEYGFRKSTHAAALIKEGRNLATTHQAFKYYSQETLRQIREQKYTLIIDENVEIVERTPLHHADAAIAIDAGRITITEEGLGMTGMDKYDGKAFAEMAELSKTRKLVHIERKDERNSLFYWTLPANLITSFNDVIILTYMFDGQSLCRFLEANNIEYTYIGIARDEFGFRFSDCFEYIPEYVGNLRDMICICKHEKLNSIGEAKHALSMNWLKNNRDQTMQLKNNIVNYFRNICKESTAKTRLWTTYTCAQGKLRGKGYTGCFLAFNTKSTNAYSGAKYLAYCINLYVNVGEKLFYEMNGVTVDDDAYALSTMVQWIWRSAIRNGEKIYIYIPSKRMRTLLENWIEKTIYEFNLHKEN